MRGLLIKDMELTLVNKRTIPVFLIITIMLLVTGDESMTSFAVAFLTMVCGMMVISSISYDEFEHGTAYLLTLPVSRKKYVAEKYVFTIVAMLSGLVCSMVLTMLSMLAKGYDMDMVQWLISCAATYAVLFAIISIMIPIQLKFGGENGRIVLIAFMAIIFVIAFAGVRIIAWAGEDAERIAADVIQTVAGLSTGVIIGAGAALLLVIVAITVVASNRIMENKEF